MVAALEGHEACVQLLLNAGADANTKDNEGITAITSAAEKGYTNIVKMLLSHKVDLDSFTQTDFSPLILASAHGHDEDADAEETAESRQKRKKIMYHEIQAEVHGDDYMEHTHDDGVTHAHEGGDVPHTHEEDNMVKKIVKWIWYIVCWPLRKAKEWIG